MNKTFAVEYRPILSNSIHFGRMHEADYTNMTVIDAESIKQAREFFHEGNNGIVVAIEAIHG